jgi:hypothetical protein
LLKARVTVREDLVLELAAMLDEADVELEFGDVDAKRRSCHEMSSSDIIWRRRGSSLQIQALLQVEVALDTVRPRGAAIGCRELV